jgi:hypothetical protein
MGRPRAYSIDLIKKVATVDEVGDAVEGDGREWLPQRRFGAFWENVSVARLGWPLK